MLFIGYGSSNIEELFKEITKYLDNTRSNTFNHIITPSTSIEEVF